MLDTELQEVQIIKKANDSDFFGKAAIRGWESKYIYSVLGCYPFSLKITYICGKNCPDVWFRKYIEIVSHKALG